MDVEKNKVSSIMYWSIAFNIFAGAFCFLVFLLDVFIGNWTMACVQLALASLNTYLAYSNYVRYKELKH